MYRWGFVCSFGVPLEIEWGLDRSDTLDDDSFSSFFLVNLAKLVVI